MLAATSASGFSGNEQTFYDILTALDPSDAERVARILAAALKEEDAAAV